MRIISGELRGRQVALAHGAAVRPTADRVREALFNILQTEVAGAHVLDLFTGSGCIGLEALSRGAAHVVFCDHDALCIRALEENLSRFRVDAAQYMTLRMDATAALAHLARTGASFDFVYIDPPYRGELYADAMAGVVPLLRPDAWLVVEHPFGMPFPFAPSGLLPVDSRRYGTVNLRFFRKEASV